MEAKELTGEELLIDYDRGVFTRPELIEEICKLKEEPITFRGIIKPPTEPSQWTKLVNESERVFYVMDKDGNIEKL